MPDTEEQMMLTLTDSAVTAIRNLTAQPELPDETGLRIMSQDQGGPAFQVTLAETPADGDQVIEAEGARVFLEPGAAVALDDKSLDAQVDDEGTVAFTLAEQAV
jgi:Fe-S cluster assembly iron-binding protein IscA